MVDVEHRFENVGGVTWHWVEAGSGEPVVLLHGIPESWQCWRHQIPVLATQFRVLAFDLKGYGQSDTAEGDYSADQVARELLACLDTLGIQRFRLAGHDWGVLISDHIIHQCPQRVLRYVRCCLSLHRYDVRYSLHHQWNAENPQQATLLMRRAEAYVRVWFESSCKPGLVPDDEEIAEIAAEFARDGVAEAVPRYFRDLRKQTPVDYSRFTMPVLYVHGEHDPRQPIDYCRGMEQHVPGLEAILVLDSGHFVARERPQELARAMQWFFNAMLSGGVPLFDRSRFYGLPTMPTKPRGAWGVNAFEVDTPEHAGGD